MPLSDSERRACEQYEIDPRLLNASGISRLRTLQRCGTSAEELRSTSICDDFLQSPSKTADSDIPDALAICGEPPRGQGFTSWWNWTDRKDRLKCAIAARDSAAYLASFATEDSVAHSASGAKGDAAEYLASRRDQRAWNLLRECPSSASLTCQQLFGNQKVPDDDAAFAEWQRICGGLSIAQKLSPLEDTLREFVAAFPPQRHGYFGFNLKAMMALDPLGTKNWWYPTSANWLVGLLAVAAFTKNACISQSSIIWRGYPYYMFAPMFEVPKDVDLLIRTCQEKLLIVGLVLLGRSGGHQNALIFDYVDYTVSRSEPHGQQTSYGYSPRDLDEKLEAHFTSIDSRWRYLGTEQACLATGLQTLENKENVQVPNDPGGFCQAWTLYWAHMRLLHPSATRKQLIKESTDALLWAKAQGLIPNLTAFIAAYSTVLLRAGLVLLNAMRPNVKPLVMSDYGNMTKKESEVAARLALTLPTLMAYVARFQTSKSGGRTVCAEGRQPKLVPLRPSNCGKICRKIPPHSSLLTGFFAKTNS